MESGSARRSFDLIPDAIVILSGTGELRGANTRTVELFGWELEEWRGRNVLDLIHPEDLEWALASLSSVTGKEIGTAIEVRLRGRDDWHLVEVVGRSFEEDGEDRILISARDLTGRRAWEVAGDDTELFRALLHNSPSLTVLVGEDGIVRSTTGAYTRMTGRPTEGLIKALFVDALVPGDRAAFSQVLGQLLAGERRAATVEVVLNADGRPPVPCQLSVLDLRDDPSVRGIAITGQDIAELRRARSQLEHLAGHDTLTGLPNRASLTAHLAERIKRTDGRRQTLVAFIDLDRFKPVNDFYGHEVGDELLVAVADRLRAAIRDDDLVARFGGDEFVIVAEVGSDQFGQILSERIHQALADPFDLSIGQVHITASVGAVVCAPNTNVATVLAEADAAMYSQKHDRGSVAEGRTATAARALAEELSQALEGGDFVVYYQPIVDLPTGSWVGLEALSRWNHAERGLLLPDQFIDIIERTGQSYRLGELVLASVATDLRRLKAATGAEPGIAINATASEITMPGYPTLVTNALREGGIHPGRLTVELSEHEIFNPASRQGDAMRTSLLALADAGVHLAVDDFGTGFSSLTHLVTLPVDTIKIDRSFVAGVTRDPQRHSVIAALVGLAKNTGKNIVAEGVDHEQQIAVLRSLQCRYAQGFHFARPMPIDEVIMAYETQEALRSQREVAS